VIFRICNHWYKQGGARLVGGERWRPSTNGSTSGCACRWRFWRMAYSPCSLPLGSYQRVTGESRGRHQAATTVRDTQALGRAHTRKRGMH
jgi:hypothetical protein